MKSVLMMYGVNQDTGEVVFIENLEWGTGAAAQYYPEDGFSWNENILSLDTSSPFSNLPSYNYIIEDGGINFYFDSNQISSGTTYETYISLIPENIGTTDVCNGYFWLDSTNIGHLDNLNCGPVRVVS